MCLFPACSQFCGRALKGESLLVARPPIHLTTTPLIPSAAMYRLSWALPYQQQGDLVGLHQFPEAPLLLGQEEFLGSLHSRLQALFPWPLQP